MYSAKVNGNSGNDITNQSTAKAQLETAVKNKQAFSQQPPKK